MTWWPRYVGIPFIDRGRGDDGADCWGLARLIYRRELGIKLPGYGEISCRDLIRVAQRMRDDQGDWEAPEIPGVFDVVLMRGVRFARVCHVGVMATAASMIHTEPACDATLVGIDHFLVKDRIAGFRRHRAMRR